MFSIAFSFLFEFPSVFLFYLCDVYSCLLCTSFQLLQFDMWGVKPSDQWDWERLKLEIVKHGLRNSLVTAQMPAASSGQLLGSNEGVQPYMTNVYSRHLSTDFQVRLFIVLLFFFQFME